MASIRCLKAACSAQHCLRYKVLSAFDRALALLTFHCCGGASSAMNETSCISHHVSLIMYHSTATDHASRIAHHTHENYPGRKLGRPGNGRPYDVNYSSLFTLHSLLFTLHSLPFTLYSSLLYHPPAFHNEVDFFERCDIGRWITRDCDDIGIVAGLNRSHAIGPTDQIGCVDGC